MSFNQQGLLLRDLRRHVSRCTIGSEPFAAALRAIEDTAWACLLSRDIDWPALQVFSGEVYVRKVHTYSLVPGGGIERTYCTPDAPLKHLAPTEYQKEVQRIAKKAWAQFIHHANWIGQKFAEAINEDDGTYSSTRHILRCLKGEAAFVQRMADREQQLRTWIAGTKDGKQADNDRVRSFIRRHGQVHFYMDGLYSSREAAEDAVRRDSIALPADFFMLVAMWEAAFPPTGVNEEALAELEEYVRSVEHKVALQEAEHFGCDPALLSYKEQRIQWFVRAVRAVTLFPGDVLPLRNLGKLLGCSESKRLRMLKAEKAKLLDGGTALRKSELLRILKNRLEKLSPSRKQRRKREAVELSTMEKFNALSQEQQEQIRQAPQSNATTPCPPGCKCCRHGC
ncbi:MAG: hypothetical protein WCC22_20835 [Terriglobales bacterium]